MVSRRGRIQKNILGAGDNDMNTVYSLLVLHKSETCQNFLGDQGSKIFEVFVETQLLPACGKSK